MPASEDAPSGDGSAARRAIVPARGTVTFLFTDIEGSTIRWERYGAAMEVAVRRHDAILRDALAARSGHVFKTVGDGFFVAFAAATDALRAALDVQRALAAEDWSHVDGLRVRMAIHVGPVESRDGDYFGRPLNRAARILAAGHGGQILVSSTAAQLIETARDAAIGLRDLGPHRLKDLEVAEAIFQVCAPDLPGDFPPLRSLQAKPTNLPIQPTRFIGRTAELTGLRARIGQTRLLTLMGFGGVGKSRLALQLAADSVDAFPDGVWHVDLSPIASPEVVAEETARTIGARVTNNESGAQAVLAALREKRTLLVFDGCEHVLGAVATLVDTLLRGCPQVSILATTRQSLDVPGEAIHAVDAFELPPRGARTAAEIAPYAAVQLFIERAVATSTSFTLTDDSAADVAEICRKVDGIALAIELAAAKITILTPRQLAGRLDERFRLLTASRRGVLPRQQTLRALIDWSFDLLDAVERLIFCRLCTFAGSWTLEAATAVCTDADLDEWRTLDGCAALVAKSLIVAEPAPDQRRFHLLDSIRAYGREKLVAAGEADLVAERSARYHAELLRRLEPHVDADDEQAWRSAVEPETDNLRGVVEWALVEGANRPLGRALLVELEWPQSVTTPREAIGWFDLAASATTPWTSPRDQARFYAHYGRLAWLVDRPIPWREAVAQRVLDQLVGSDDAVALALARNVLANVYLDAGRHAEAEAIFARTQDVPHLPRRIAKHDLRDRAINDLERGELELARERFGRVARLETPGSVGHGVALLNLAELEFAAGNFDAARSSGRAAKDILTRLRAAPLALLACNLAAYEMAADAFDAARTALREALDRLGESGHVWALAALEHHAVFCGLTGDIETALLLCGHTDAHVSASGGTRKSTERHGYERLLHKLRSAVGSELTGRLESGAGLTREQALALAENIHAPSDTRPAPSVIGEFTDVGTTARNGRANPARA